MKKLTCTVICLLMVIGQSCAMQPSAAKAGIKAVTPFLKKGFSGTMTAAHWTIAGMPIIGGIVRSSVLLFEKNICNQMPDADIRATSFISSKLEKVGVNIKGVKIIPPSIGPNNMMAFPHHILIQREMEDEIGNAIENEDKNSQKRLSSILEHEASHIHHNDTFWRACAQFTVPFLTHKTTKVIRSALPYAKKAKPFLWQQCIKVPTGFGKLALSMGFITALSRHQELRADNEIANDIDTLRSFRDYLESHFRDDTQDESTLTPKAKLVKTTKDIFSSHPSTEKRIQKLDQRIALLEKNEKNNSKPS